MLSKCKLINAIVTMACHRIAENEHACLVLKASSFDHVADVEIQFKKTISCLRTSEDVTKDLFDTFMQQCKTSIMKAMMFIDIDYELRQGSQVITKTTTYYSSRRDRFLCVDNANHFYRQFMRYATYRMNRRCSSPQCKIIKVKRIGMNLIYLPQHEMKKPHNEMQTSLTIPTTPSEPLTCKVSQGQKKRHYKSKVVKTQCLPLKIGKHH